MRRNVGLPIMPGVEKLVIDVSMMQPPGHILPWISTPVGLRVPSLVLYKAPVELTDTELLLQSIALPLLEHVLAQVNTRYKIGAAWQPLLDGLRLWQLWDLDLSLAAWREEVVKWLYVDLPAVGLGQSLVLPDHYPELCTAHKLWVSSPVQLGIPLVCTELDGQNWYYPSWGPRDPLLRLDQLTLWMAPEEYIRQSGASSVPHLGQTVALATLIEYAVATYGRERLPALVAGLGQYDSWETLLPAVFGVSAAKFEAGWQAYLVTHYGL